MKRHSINTNRTKEGIHEVIVYAVTPSTSSNAYVKKVQQGAS
jgi:hypothetical protein